jgi:hypothetical protein
VRAVGHSAVAAHRSMAARGCAHEQSAVVSARRRGSRARRRLRMTRAGSVGVEASWTKRLRGLAVRRAWVAVCEAKPGVLQVRW